MTGQFQGGLANLWAVGGLQTASEDRESSGGYYRYCPGCGWRLTGKFSTCPRCKADLSRIVCPYCRGTIPAGNEQCPRCTAPLA
jgi:predicted amidophosphoribosyltransferase